MKAFIQTAYGPPERVLEMREIDPPPMGEHDVMIRVRAASLHAGDYFLAVGSPWPARFAVGFPKPHANYVVGLDSAGVVEQVGASVTRFTPGDEVFAECSPRADGSGACAELTCAPEDNVVRKPSNLSFEEAAAIPVSALAALHGIRDAGKVQPGQKVLIVGAAGGVGTFAVQIAKWLGAEVTGVCSTGNVELVRSLGADHVIDYTQGGLHPRRSPLRPHPRQRGRPLVVRGAPGAQARRRAAAQQRPVGDGLLHRRVPRRAVRQAAGQAVSLGAQPSRHGAARRTRRERDDQAGSG